MPFEHYCPLKSPTPSQRIEALSHALLGPDKVKDGVRSRARDQMQILNGPHKPHLRHHRRE